MYHHSHFYQNISRYVKKRFIWPTASRARPRSIPARRPVMLQRGCSALSVMLLGDGGKINNTKHAVPGRRSARRWDRFHASPVWDKPKPARRCCCCCCRRRRSVMRNTEARTPVMWPSSSLPRWTDWPWLNGVTRCRKRGDGAPRLQHSNLPKSYYCEGLLLNFNEISVGIGRSAGNVSGSSLIFMR